MKPIEWEHPNKMLIDTGHRTFDAKCRCVTPGNAITETQLSILVRGENVTMCNGLVKPFGFYRDFDMHEPWIRNAPHAVHDTVRAVTDDSDQSAIVYWFFHWNRHKRVEHGWIVTDSDRRALTVVNTGTKYDFSQRVLVGVLPYIAEDAVAA